MSVQTTYRMPQPLSDYLHQRVAYNSVPELPTIVDRQDPQNTENNSGLPCSCPLHLFSCHFLTPHSLLSFSALVKLQPLFWYL